MPAFAARVSRGHRRSSCSIASGASAIAAGSTTSSTSPAPAPPPLVVPDSGCEIGTPDLVTTALETHTLPADGFVEYRYLILPHVFLRDTGRAAAEILPSSPRVLHHCNMAFVAIGRRFDDGNVISGGGAD